MNLERTQIMPPSRSELEEWDRKEAAQPPEDHAWPPKIDNPELTDSFWRDPDPQNTAVLTGDRIREYHYEVGRMIRPFQEAYLNPASYDLTLGPRCLIDGEEEILSVRNPILRIPPGSIALAPSRETLLIPHWLVATFNLKSQYIFRGLLMGIGPQIDPGFMGVLTCPLHNVSCEPIDLHFCKPFAKLDFIRTTWGTTVDLNGIASEDELYKRSAERRLKSTDPAPVPVTLWPREDNFRPPLSAGRRAAGVKGSLGDLKEQIKSFRRSLSLGGLGGAALAITTIAAVVGVGAFALVYTDGRVEDAKDDAVRAARHEARAVVNAQGHSERVRHKRAALPE